MIGNTNPVAEYPRLSQDWLKHETDPQMGRTEVVVAGGAGDLKTGTVLGMVSASKKWVPLAPAATDGSQTAAGILYGRTDASGTADVKGVAITGDARVAPLELTFPAGITDAQKAAAMAQLAALEIIPVRLY